MATIFGAYVRSSFAFCTLLFADRSRVAASRILLVAAPCVILLCFAAESCKSHCNGGVKVATPALMAAIFFRFWHYYSFSFKNSF